MLLPARLHWSENEATFPTLSPVQQPCLTSAECLEHGDGRLPFALRSLADLRTTASHVTHMSPDFVADAGALAERACGASKAPFLCVGTPGGQFFTLAPKPSLPSASSAADDGERAMATAGGGPGGPPGAAGASAATATSNLATWTRQLGDSRAGTPRLCSAARRSGSRPFRDGQAHPAVLGRSG